MQISIVIPLLDEAASLPTLHEWIEQVMKKNGYKYELIFIDDGSKDDSWRIIKTLCNENHSLRAIRFKNNSGKSQSLDAGFAVASGRVVITMDADLQDSPEEIPALYDMIKKEGYDLVSGWKKIRYDSKFAKNIPSKIFNWAARKTSKIPLHDFNCGIKAYRNEVIKNIKVQGDMHRYIPILAKNAGFRNIGEKIVKHRPRKYGVSKFGIERFSNGLLDLITIWFISRFGKRPMHFFGLIGLLIFALSFFSVTGIGAYKIIALYKGIPAIRITEFSWFYIALTGMLMGTQLFIAGFIGELLLRNKSLDKPYLITSTIRIPKKNVGNNTLKNNP